MNDSRESSEPQIISQEVNNESAEEIDNESDEPDEIFSFFKRFVEYVPSKLKFGHKHPDSIIETSSLSNVLPPDIKYKLSIPKKIYKSKKLSNIQLEAIIYACQQHEKFLSDGSRAGFLLGDGSGVGKGRTVAGIIYENYLNGRKKSIWFSVNADLNLDVQRDLVDIGVKKIKVHALNTFKYGKLQDLYGDNIKKGVIFSTYHSLISKSSNVKGKYGNRLGQLVDWCGEEFDGVIVFDECHKAKNLIPDDKIKFITIKSSKTAFKVVEIQQKLPKARIVYVSATGASEVRHMAYMVRLGLWDHNDSGFKDFEEFWKAIEDCGVTAMELVAMEIKRRGMYLARQLSFKNVTFDIKKIELKEDFIELYNDCVDLWSLIREKFVEASSKSESKNQTMSQFWSSHLRFFGSLCISAKVDEIVRVTEKEIKNGNTVVIGLLSTGEASALEALNKSGTSLDDFVSTSKVAIQILVEKYFPGSNHIKKDLLKLINKLDKRFPQNTIDKLITKLGGPTEVAEITGRTFRLISDDGKIVAKKMAKSFSLEEKQNFLNDEKNIVIISEKASTGISLHSDRRFRNRKRRVHLTIEIPWSADRIVQQFGRTHRSNQVNSPKYVFMISKIAGEIRFASIGARRLEHLGALTHGDRRAAETRDLSSFSIDHSCARRAIKSLMQEVMDGSIKLSEDITLDDIQSNMINTGLIVITNKNDIKETEIKETNINKFLHRLLGMKINIQNYLFDYFVKILNSQIRADKSSDLVDEGMIVLSSKNGQVKIIKHQTHETVYSSNVTTIHKYFQVSYDRGISWQKALELYNQSDKENEEGFYKTRSTRFKNKNLFLAIKIKPYNACSEGKFRIFEANIGMSNRILNYSELKNIYIKIKSLREAEKMWCEIYEKSEFNCYHIRYHGKCKKIEDNIICNDGKRKKNYSVLTGFILAELPWIKLLISNSGKKNLQTVRLECDNFSSTGILIPGQYMVLDQLIDTIKNLSKQGRQVSLEEENYSTDTVTSTDSDHTTDSDD